MDHKIHFADGGCVELLLIVILGRYFRRVREPSLLEQLGPDLLLFFLLCLLLTLGLEDVL